MALNLTKNCTYLKSIKIYENENQFYFIGEHNLQKKFYIYTIKKLHFTSDNYHVNTNLNLSEIIVEYHSPYTKLELKGLVNELSKNSATHLRFIEEVFAIFGFVKFYLGYYAILINETSQIGKISKYVINRVDKMKYLPLFLSTELKQDKCYELENKYLSIFKGIDFTKQLYFSFTYNWTKTLQRNFIENWKSEWLTDYDLNFYKDCSNDNAVNVSTGASNAEEKKCKINKCEYQNRRRFDYDWKKITNNYFLWNHYHLKEFFNWMENKIWCVYFIYGFYEQIECSIYGLRFWVSVIARRNRYYAGTRYLKRGINNDGNVANDVETEQILEEISTSCSDQPNISSFIHIRGSVPIYWRQEQNSILPKPDIKLNFSDFEFDATKRHFNSLTQRYGRPSLVCNLTKAREGKKRQETLLNEWYQTSIEYVNNHNNLSTEEQIKYYHYDWKALRQLPKFYKTYCDESCKWIAKTNMFCFIPHWMNNTTYMLSLQNGVIRSNCVDCLDRTNVYQQVIGTAVMVIQLRILGVQAFEPDNEYEEIYGILTEIYKKMGNELSSQYAGSLAHKQTIKDTRSKMDKFINKFPEMFNTFKRYFNNSFNDQSKQNAMNLFLGKYTIEEGQPPIWDIINDTDWHKKRNWGKWKKTWAKESFDTYTKYNLLCDIYDKYNSISTITNKRELLELGRYFNWDVIEKIKISKFNKQWPVLTSKVNNNEYKDMSNYINSNTNNTFDYLIRLDKYLNYKKTHPIKYFEQIMYHKEIPIFRFWNIDPKEQIKTFEKFAFKQEGNSANEADNLWWMVNNPKNQSDNDNSDNIVVWFDETIQRGITTSQQMFAGDVKKQPRRPGNYQKMNSVNIYAQNSIESNGFTVKNTNDFSICSFDWEDDLSKKVVVFCQPNLAIHGDCVCSNSMNDPDFLVFEDIIGDVNDPTDFMNDILTKVTTLELENRWVNGKNMNGDEKELDYDIYVMKGKSEFSRINNSRKSKGWDGDSVLQWQRICLPVKIDENHFPD